MLKNDKKTSLRPNQQAAIEALLSGMTKQQAASAGGVQPPTLSRWLRDDVFKTALQAQGEEAMTTATMRLRGAVDTAVTVLVLVMESPDSTPVMRLRAADMVVSHALRLLEHNEIVERLRALEARQ